MTYMYTQVHRVAHTCSYTVYTPTHTLYTCTHTHTHTRTHTTHTYTHTMHTHTHITHTHTHTCTHTHIHTFLGEGSITLVKTSGMEDLAEEEEAARMDLVQRTPSGVSRGSERAEGGVLGEEGAEFSEVVIVLLVGGKVFPCTVISGMFEDSREGCKESDYTVMIVVMHWHFGRTIVQKLVIQRQS